MDIKLRSSLIFAPERTQFVIFFIIVVKLVESLPNNFFILKGYVKNRLDLLPHFGFLCWIQAQALLADKFDWYILQPNC